MAVLRPPRLIKTSTIFTQNFTNNEPRNQNFPTNTKPETKPEVSVNCLQVSQELG